MHDRFKRVETWQGTWVLPDGVALAALAERAVEHVEASGPIVHFLAMAGPVSASQLADLEQAAPKVDFSRCEAVQLSVAGLEDRLRVAFSMFSNRAGARWSELKVRGIDENEVESVFAALLDSLR